MVGWVLLLLIVLSFSGYLVAGVLQSLKNLVIDGNLILRDNSLRTKMTEILRERAT